MRDKIQGTFHFHSTYSHDGRSTLAEITTRLRHRGFSFCIMTEHFEDFDAPKFGRYVEEVGSLNRQHPFVLVPGVEINLAGIDTIIFPVSDYESCARFAATADDSENRFFSVLAHPSKYPFHKVTAHLEKYRIRGFELWNQQADGRQMPPLQLFASIESHAGWGNYKYFFGCDLHDVNLTVANSISLTNSSASDVSSIVAEFVQGDFIVSNAPTGIQYDNRQGGECVKTWLKNASRGSYFRGRMLRYLRRTLRCAYRALPKETQRSVNDFKNYVRNKV